MDAPKQKSAKVIKLSVVRSLMMVVASAPGQTDRDESLMLPVSDLEDEGN